MSTNTCCSPSARSSCCDTSNKAACCGPANESCACAAGVENAALPTLVIGAGPIGLAAAAQLQARGEPFLVVEAGQGPGAAIARWGHVRLFSPWRYLIDSTSEALLNASGWSAPDRDVYPLGAELVRGYLAPLAALPQLAPHIAYGTRAVAVSRHGVDKLKTAGREAAPFEIHLVAADGAERVVRAKAVIDASGTYATPNPLGASGLPAPGERAAANRIDYHIPDVLGAERARFAGGQVLVVGSGHSAFNTALELDKLAREAPSTRVTWAIRRNDPGQMFGGGVSDELAQRGELGGRARRLIDDGRVQLETGVRVERIDRDADGRVRVFADDGRVLGPFDRVVANTGFRPNVNLLSELRLALDDRNDAPIALAPLIDPNLHSCGSVPAHGYEELRHPAEPGVYVIGMKSYGRAPTFLMLTGYEQARSVVAAIAGDMAAARDVRLVLPETGVCSSDLGGSCCATPAPALISLAEIA
jgi:thioredoxin reductase